MRAKRDNFGNIWKFGISNTRLFSDVPVTDSKEEVCVDPGEKGAILEAGGPGLPGGEKAGSWLQTAEEKRHTKMAKGAGDGLPTSSRDGYA